MSIESFVKPKSALLPSLASCPNIQPIKLNPKILVFRGKFHLRQFYKMARGAINQYLARVKSKLEESGENYSQLSLGTGGEARGVFEYLQMVL